MATIETLGTFVPDNLIAGSVDIVVDAVKLSASQTLKRGTALGKKTENGECVPVDSTKSDGSQDIFAVLIDDVVVGDTADYAEVYLSGEFSEGALIFGGNDTADKHRDKARDLGIYFRKTLKEGK